MMFMTVDGSGFASGFYSEDLHGSRTRPVIEVVQVKANDDPNDTTTIPQPKVVGSEPNPDCKIPVDAIEITDEQWQEFIENPGRRQWHNGAVVVYTPPPVPVDLTAYAANARWVKETSGITVGGVAVATDDRSKQMVMGARIAADADGNFTTQWVASDGSISTLTAPQIIAISDAVLAHVAACFAKYADVKPQIDGGTITTPAQIDAAFAAVAAGL